MANNVPCYNQPVKYVSCCDVMNCMNIKSSDNTVTVETSDCGVDIRYSGNNLDQILDIKNGTCIQMVKEFVNGKLTITPVIDWNCVVSKIGSQICESCAPPVTCSAPLQLVVAIV